MSAMIGGTASVLGGGKFTNGAQTASFGYMFNYCAHNGCSNKSFGLSDAIDQWRNGYGSEVSRVNASEIPLAGASYVKNPDGSYQIHTFSPIYGTVTADLTVNGTMTIRPDTYNFDIKWPKNFRMLVRDDLTIAGLIVNGFGHGYQINFVGTIPAPKDLPK